MATKWKDTDGTVASVSSWATRGGSRRYRIVFTYKVDGHWCGGTFSTSTGYTKGDTLPVQYDPADPERNKYVVDEKRMRIALAVFAVVAVVAILFALQQRS